MADPPAPRPARLAVAALVFGTGLSAMVYQIAWLRGLRLVFGSSTGATAAVLVLFMGGLGFGALLLGPRADRHPAPFRLYARLELGVAGLALLSPWLLDLVGVVWTGLGGTATLGGVGGTAIRVALVALVLGPPTLLMGGTLPAAARAVEVDADPERRHLALIYGANTVGAVLGAFFATFVLLEALGARATIHAAASWNTLVAIVALGLASRAAAPASPSVPGAVGGPAAPDSDRAEPAVQGRSPAPLLAAAAAVGFVFMLMELVWYRMLGPMLGGTTWTFGLILTFALLGIGLGSLAFQRARPDAVSWAALATTCALEAVFIAVPLAIGDDFAVGAAAIRGLGALGFWGLVLAWSAVAAIAVLPAAIVAGYQFPLLVALRGRGATDLGRDVGQVYASNTLGSIAGALAGGFGLLPLLSAPGAWRAAVGILLAVAAGAAASALRASGSRRSLLAAGPLWVVALILVTASGPTPVWRQLSGGVGGPDAEPMALEAALRHRRRAVVWDRDGVESAITVIRGSSLLFAVNGRVEGNARLDAPTTVMLGLLGPLLHPAEPRRSLVVGLGQGTTAGWLAAVPSMERVDVVELEPAVLEVARGCAAINGDVLEDPRVRVTVGDARELLLTADDTWDIISSEPSHPFKAGIGSLFTREFYAASERRLAPDGVFVQWLQAYEADPVTVRLVYTTLASVFGAVEVWQSRLEADLVFVATRTPRLQDPRRLADRLRAEPYRSALARVWGVEGLEGLYTGFVAGPALAPWLRERDLSDVATDDDLGVEYGYVRSLRGGRFDMGDLHALARAAGAAEPPLPPGSLDRALRAESVAARAMVERVAPPLPPAQDAGASWRAMARAAWSRGDLEGAAASWRRQDQPPGNPADMLLWSEAMAHVGDADALRHADALRRTSRAAALAVEAIVAIVADPGGADPAVEALVAAFEAYRSDPWPVPAVMERLLARAQALAPRSPAVAQALWEALGEPFAVDLLHEERLRVRLHLARIAGQEGRCVEAMEAFEPHFPWERGLLEDRLRCYAVAGHWRHAQARADLLEWLRAAPQPIVPDAAFGAPGR